MIVEKNRVDQQDIPHWKEPARMKVIIITILVAIVTVYITVAVARDLPPFSPAAVPAPAPAPAPTPELTPTPTPTPTPSPQPPPTPTVVTTTEMGTDSSWKSLDAAVKGWASAAFDDSWWSDSWESDHIASGFEKARAIWYPEKPVPLTAYFRKSFEISGVEVISGRIYVVICAYGEGVSTMPDTGKVYIYVNDKYVGKLTSGGYMNNWWRKKDLDITPYLTVGNNVIAVKVEFAERTTKPPTVSKYSWWALNATIRYATTQ